MNAGCAGKLWNPLRTHAIPERLRGVFTTMRYTNPSLPYLTLPATRNTAASVFQARRPWIDVYPAYLQQLDVPAENVSSCLWLRSASNQFDVLYPAVKTADVIKRTAEFRLLWAHCGLCALEVYLYTVSFTMTSLWSLGGTRSVFLLLLTVWHGITRAWTHLNQSCIHFIFHHHHHHHHHHYH